jgi:glycosyltransferase involved in cell wall biosynthesis
MSQKKVIYVLGENYVPERAPVSRATEMVSYLNANAISAELLLICGDNSPTDPTIKVIQEPATKSFKWQLLITRLRMVVYLFPLIIKKKSRLTIIFRDPFISVLIWPLLVIFRVKKIHDFHGFVYPALEKEKSFGYWIQYIFEKLTIYLYKTALSVNQSLSDQLPSGSNTTIVSNGVDLKRFNRPSTNPYQSMSIPSENCIAVFVGFMCFFLDLELIIDSAKSNNSITYVVIGNGSEYDKAMMRNDLPKNLFLMGFLKKDDVINYIKHADIGIVAYTWKNSPNLKTNRSTARKISEYMAAGLPMVICDSVPEADSLRANKNCLFYETGNSKNLTFNVLSLYENKEKMSSLRDNNLIQVKQFSWEQLFQESGLKDIV